MIKHKNDMKNRDLPGTEGFRHKLNEEEEERLFYDLLYSKMNKVERLNLFWPYPYKDKNDRERLKEVRKFAANYQIELPITIKRQLRTWTGSDRYKQMKKSRGSKYSVNLIDHIQKVIPLSIKALNFTFDNHSLKWKRESDGKEFTFYLPIDKKDIMKPASGDLAKRVILNTFRFAIARRTYDPGPITYAEFLDNLGESSASQIVRQRIKDICESCAFTSMTIRKKDEKGEEIYFRHTPFFKNFIWEGKLDNEAVIYPVINEQFERMLIEEDFKGYIWFADERLKRLPKGMTARDRLAQDQFKMFLGLPVVRFIMRNWLYRFGQFTDTKIMKLKLADIKEFVNKNIILAKEDGLIDHFKIQRLQKKSRYLDQIIYIYPSKSVSPKKILTEKEKEEIEEIANHLYEKGVEGYADKSLDEIRGQLLNSDLDCLRQAFEWTEDEFDPSCLADESRNFKNWPMMFWDKYRECIENKKPEK